MSAVEFYYDNFLLDATLLGAYGQNDLFPATNITDPRLTKVFRTAEGITEGKVFYDLGEDRDPTHCLVKLNPIDPIFPNRYLLIRGGNNFVPGMLTTPRSNFPHVYFQINQSAFDRFSIISGTRRLVGNAFRHWSINSTKNADKDFAEISKVFLGTKTLGLENIGIDYGWSLATNSLDKISRNRYGQKFIDKVIHQRVLSLGIRLITKGELDIFMDMFEAVGTHRPIWIVIDPGEVIFNNKERFMIYGYFNSVPTITNNVFSHYDLDLVIEEAI